MPPLLPPTSPDLEEPSTKPYFLWWTHATVGDLRRALQDPDAGPRAYRLGALLREANQATDGSARRDVNLLRGEAY